MTGTFSDFGDLVLLIGDFHVPQRASGLPASFRELLRTDKIKHILCTGNVCSSSNGGEMIELLRSISPSLHIVKGDCDPPDCDFSEYKVLQFGEIKVGLIHGHQIVPWGEAAALLHWQRKLGVDVLVYGHTHRNSVLEFHKKFFINPGSATGAFQSWNASYPPTPFPSVNYHYDGSISGEDRTVGAGGGGGGGSGYVDGAGSGSAAAASGSGTSAAGTNVAGSADSVVGDGNNGGTRVGSDSGGGVDDVGGGSGSRYVSDGSGLEINGGGKTNASAFESSDGAIGRRSGGGVAAAAGKGVAGWSGDGSSISSSGAMINGEVPSFMLMAVQGRSVVLYVYEERNGKPEVVMSEFRKTEGC